MSRVLSLALVLVMLVGIVPMALASQGEGGSVSISASNDTVNTKDTVSLTANVQNPEGYKPETYAWSGATGSGINAEFKADQPGDFQVTVAVSFVPNEGVGQEIVIKSEPVTIHVNGPDTPVKVNVSIAAPAKAALNQPITLTAKVDNEQAKVSSWNWSGEVTGTGASISYTPTTVGKKTFTVTPVFEDAEHYTADAATVTVEVVENAVVTINPTAMELKVGENKTVSVALNKADGASNGVTIKSVAWSGGNDIVTVDGRGEGAILTGKKKGTAAVTATVTLSAGDPVTVTCNVTVKDGATINQNNVSAKYYNGATITLRPTLSYNPGKQVSWAYERVSGNITVGNNGVVTATGAGEAQVRITAKWGEGADEKETKVVFVSFYVENAPAEVTLRNNLKQFKFNDYNVFSKVVLGNYSQNNPQNFNMMNVLDMGGGMYLSTAVVSPNASRVGKLSNSFGTVDEIPPTNAPFNITFTVLGAGKYTFRYDAYTSNKMMLATGEVTIVTGDAKADLTIQTTRDKAITLNEKDFLRLWDSFRMKKGLSNVMFTSQPVNGDLYVDSKAKTKVTEYDRFYLSGVNNKRLGDVTYVPSNRFLNNYEDTISFTMYGEQADEVVYCTLVIKVGNNMPFRDVNKSDWFYDDVQYVYSNGIMDGVSAYEFAPQNKLTRGMVVTMLYRMEGKPITFRSGTFTDVQRGTWYTDAVEWAAENKIVEGYGKTFGPNNNITRQDLAVILYRYAKYKGQSTYSSSSLTGFSDYQRVASYATDAMQWAVYNKIIGGNDRGMLSPNGNATRAEAAKMFHVFLEKK